MPLSLAHKPIAVLLLVQLQSVPLTELEKNTAVDASPLHKIWSAGFTSIGVGFTMMVNVLGTAGQIPFEGVTVIVAVSTTLPVFTAVKAGISPLPLAARPMDGLLFVQLKLVPLNVPVKATVFVVDPLHNTWFAGCATVGDGYIFIVNV